ncbi:SIR2 family protein [Alicyclobacillus fodiniaquatilis]|uniref:SIR2 family protein n=1 Tax=Alicyclobacillus fodiniaquatilis TaxID=1661150 RepID=A0ABW4JCM5_9BACL
MEIPFQLRQAMEDGTCVLFVGAGMGHYMVDENQNAIPDGTALAKKLTEKFSVPVSGDSYDLTKVSQYIEMKHGGRTQLVAFIRECLIDANPSDSFMWIPSVKWKAIFTTNYDNVIQKAYDQYPSPNLNYVTITRSTGIKDFDPKLELPIFHLHGALFEEGSPNIIITQQDYVKFKEQRRMMFEHLKHYMAASCVLYIGYSHNDSNWNSLLTEIEEEFYPADIPVAYRVDPYTSALDTELLKARNIITISQKFDEFVNDAKLQVVTSDAQKISLEELRSHIPVDFRDSEELNPASALRLFSSWDYVNNGLENGQLKPDVHNYVRGDKPTWGTVFNDMYFTRDVEDEMYDSLLDYATETKNRTRVCMLSAPAGYGTSTLLMVLASRLVKDRAGQVFFHRNPTELREGDVFYALSLDSSQRKIFFIDNAADYTNIIRRILFKARESNHAVLIVLGDRRNEWAQARTQITGDTFEIQPLSDTEIERLIDFLSKYNELNKLEHLDREHQIAAIRRNYNRELLVSVREATEGNNIEAIIEDEYFGIKDEFSRRAYAIICCFHQHGSLLRIELLSSLLEVSVVQLYDKIKGFLDGVVQFECINERRGEYAARARHRIIASIVWERCLDAGTQDEIIHLAVDKMNILHRLDKAAFESFIRSDRFVDSLRTLESKIRFFEKACKKDPDNPYVRQHYARMYVRSDIESSALRTIEEAIQMNGSIRSLYHTKGYILYHMAMSSESTEVGRRRLVQSEEAYFTGLKIDDRDEYMYQGLAQLYLGWVSKQKDGEEERTIYLAKAEDIINKGLKKSRNKEGLWIESSNVDKLLGNNLGRIHSLEKAVSDAPGSIISRYLLAKAYNFNSQIDKGIKLLSELTRDNPDEYRPAIEYALSIIRSGGTMDNAIAVLNQSTLYGYSDAYFVATFGGLLFLNKEFERADVVFNEAIRREFSNARHILFNPMDVGMQCDYNAIVKYVGAGHSYVLINGFPDIICPSSKYHKLIIERGMKLKVSIAFTPLRPVVKELHKI